MKPHKYTQPSSSANKCIGLNLAQMVSVYLDYAYNQREK